MSYTTHLPAVFEPTRLRATVRDAQTTSSAQARKLARRRIASGPELLVADTCGVYAPQVWLALGR